MTPLRHSRAEWFEHVLVGELAKAPEVDQEQVGRVAAGKAGRQLRHVILLLADRNELDFDVRRALLKGGDQFLVGGELRRIAEGL